MQATQHPADTRSHQLTMARTSRLARRPCASSRVSWLAVGHTFQTVSEVHSSRHLPMSNGHHLIGGQRWDRISWAPGDVR